MWLRHLHHLVFVLLLVTAGACRMPGREGPISEALLSSRHLSQQAITAMETGNSAKAANLLSSAIKACPENADAHRHYADALWQQGAFQQAIDQQKEALQLSGEDTTLMSRLAEMYLETGRLDLARRKVDESLDLDPKSSFAWTVRGRILRREGKSREALADYHRALRETPNDRQVLLEMAELYRQLNEPHRALATLQNLSDTYAMDEEPQQVHYLTGLAYTASGRYDEACSSLSLALRKGQPTPEIFYRLAEAEMAAGRTPEATSSARNALALLPTHQPSQQLLGRLETAQREQIEKRR